MDRRTFINKYERVRELLFRFCGDVNLGRLHVR